MQTPPQKEENIYADIPDEFLDRAWAFRGYCMGRPNMADYYNCECLAVRYLDRLVELDGNATDSQLMLSINNECIDATGAAGRQYMECLQNAPIMPAEIPPEEFCTCYANTYARMFEHYQAEPSTSTFIEIQSQAMVACRDPALARRLYPYVPPPPK